MLSSDNSLITFSWISSKSCSLLSGILSLKRKKLQRQRSGVYSGHQTWGNVDLSQKLPHKPLSLLVWWDKHLVRKVNLCQEASLCILKFNFNSHSPDTFWSHLICAMFCHPSEQTYLISYSLLFFAVLLLTVSCEC